jgi:DNA gyrase subunit A
VTDVRVFRSRNSTGVRGIKLGKDEKVISLSILMHSDASPSERNSYLKQAAMLRRATEGTDEDVQDAELEETTEEAVLSPERYAAMGAQEQFLLTVSENGYGKRSSAYEYRVSGRGGKGIIAMTVTDRNGPLIASFPVKETDQIMLVTDSGTLIRCPVNDVRVAGRNTQGVTIFKTDEGANVVSVICLSETSDEAIPEEDDSEGDESSENSPDDTPNDSSDAGDA